MQILFGQSHLSGKSLTSVLACSLWMVLACINLDATPAFGQATAELLFAKTMVRMAEADSLLKDRSFSYTLRLSGTLYAKNDSVRIIEERRVSHDQDSLRIQLLSHEVVGKADRAKKYQSPLKIQPARRDKATHQNDPVLAVTWELLNRIKQDVKAYLLIDGKVTGKAGNLCYVVKFLANERLGSLWLNAQTADLERIEWAYGKSFGVVSSGENSIIELAPVAEKINFPVRLIFNERSRQLLRRTGTFTEIDIRDFHREEIP